MKFCTDLKVVKIFCGALSLGSYFLFVSTESIHKIV